MNLKAIGLLFKETFVQWQEDKVPLLAAALAYYTVFSIAPLLVIAIAIAGLAFGPEAAQGLIVSELKHLIGIEGAEAIQALLQNAYKPQSGTIAGLIGVATLLLGASGVFAQLKESLNIIWHVSPKPGRGVIGFIKDRVLTFAMVLAIGFLLLVSLIVSATLAAIGQWVNSWLAIPVSVWHWIDGLVSFSTIALLFALMYKILPDAKVAWGDVWIGAAITSLLFTAGKFLIGLYLGNSGIASAYGAAGSFVIILIWIYYSAQILFWGAEFTQVYANRFGSRIVSRALAEGVRF